MLRAKNNTVSRLGNEFETPQKRAIQQLAQVILTVSDGERLPSITELRSLIGVGTGTVQKILQDFQHEKYVELNSKQRQGTFILSKNIGALWMLAGFASLHVILPLPNSWEFQGLATGLRAAFDKISVPMTLFFGHGASHRVEALTSGVADVAAMSGYAAGQLVEKNHDLEIDKRLGQGSYYANDSVVVIARAPKNSFKERLRIGIDPQSTDHSTLTHLEFPGYDYVDVCYAHIPSALAQGVIDAAVWHRSALGLSLSDKELITWPLTNAVTIAVTKDMSETVLIVSKAKPYLRHVLNALDVERIVSTQQTIISGHALPSY